MEHELGEEVPTEEGAKNHQQSDNRAPVSLQNCEDDEAFKLLQLSKEEQTDVAGDPEDEELIIAEYESDDESRSKSR